LENLSLLCCSETPYFLREVSNQLFERHVIQIQKIKELIMKNKVTLFGFIAFAVIIGFITAGCPKIEDDPHNTDQTETEQGNTDPDTGDTDSSPKILTGTVSVNGTAQVGQTLVADTNGLGGSGTISYQWKRREPVADAFADISGATFSTYALVAADENKFIKVTVTRNGYSDSVDSDQVGPVLPEHTARTTVTGVTLTPSAATVFKGETQAFIATVSGENDPAQTVTWTVEGGIPATSINPDGVLTVANGETASSLTVRAASTIDPSKSGTAAVAVIYPKVTSVTVSPSNASVNRGETRQFTATVNKENDPLQTISDSVSWSVTGGITGTSINSDGVLTVAFGETASNLTVRAASTVDPGKSGTAAVALTTPPLSGSVNITGTAQEDNTLTANIENLIGNSLVTYQWARGDSANGSFTNITSNGASSTYTLVNADVGKLIKVTVTRSGYTGNMTSDAVGPVLAKTVPAPTVTSVTINPTSATVLLEGTQQFTATVTGTNNPAQTVTWTVTGGTGNRTAMSTNGILTVSPSETSGTLTVRATSSIDSTKSATATVTVPAVTGTVSITGNQTVGQTLTANTTSLGGSGDNITYQWARADTANGSFTNITTNGTTQTYALVAADAGKFIRVTVKRTGYRGEVTSTAVGAITRPALTGTVTISGSTTVGQQLTANTSLGGSGTITYQWKRGDGTAFTNPQNIGTGASYTLVADDNGKYIKLTVTRADNSGSVDSNTLGPITFPALTGTVTVSGTLHIDSTLTAQTGNLGGSGTISYQWARGDGSAFANPQNIGTGESYTLVSADNDKYIRVTVSRSGFSGSVNSTAVGPITRPALTGTVSITGTTQAGKTLTANTSNLGGSGNITYQWKRGDTAAAEGTNISNAASSTYTPVSADEGKFLKVTVSRANNGGNVTSAAVGPVQPSSTSDSTRTLTAVSGASEIVTYDGRQDVMKVDGTKLNSNFAVAQYSLSSYKDKEITVTLSVDVRREGAAGTLNWQINNSNYPSVAAINNAATGTWHSMSGTWKGTPTAEYPSLYLSTHENNSATTTYYIDNFTITIVETNSGGSGGNFNGVTWTNADLGNSTFQKTAKNGPYDVEMWNENKQGTASMTLGVDGAYRCSWDGINNVLFRAGRKYPNKDKTHSQIGTFTIEYAATFNPGTVSGSMNSYLSVYGWVTGGSPDALIEYYIIEARGEFNPKNSDGAIPKGTATIDGGTYEIYEVPRTNAPSIEGNKNFKQYFSVRTSNSTSGTISVSQHFAAWNTAGLTSINNGKLYEVSLKAESYGGTSGKSKGDAQVTKNILKVNGVPIQ